MRFNYYGLALVVLLSGCMHSRNSGVPVVDNMETMEFLEPGLRPETILFPRYFLMEGFELQRHGRLPGTSLVGAGMKTREGLASVRRNLNDLLSAYGWDVEKMEIESKSFRLMASFKKETVEIRAVQGSGPTQIHLLYGPDPDKLDKMQ